MESPFGNIAGPDDPDAGEPAPATRAGRRDRQHRRILDAARTCFARSGFQGAAMQEICAEAGMSPGAVYRYFASKEAIIEAICEADRREDARIFEAVLGHADVVEGLVFGAMTHIRHVHETDAAPLFAQICAEATRNAAVESTCRFHMEQVQATFRGYIGAARARGEIDPPVELDVLVPALMATVHGMALNDLPALGIAYDRLETLVRASLEGMLRPTGKAVRR